MSFHDVFQIYKSSNNVGHISPTPIYALLGHRGKWFPHQASCRSRGPGSIYSQSVFVTQPCIVILKHKGDDKYFRQIRLVLSSHYFKYKRSQRPLFQRALMVPTQSILVYSRWAEALSELVPPQRPLPNRCVFDAVSDCYRTMHSRLPRPTVSDHLQAGGLKGRLAPSSL